MMTKRHFKAMAEILKNSQDKKEIINKIAVFCREENPNFNGYTFKKACGLSDEECGY